MITFIIIGGVGLALVVLSMLVGELIELGDGAVSGTSLGVGAIVYGAVGSIVVANDLPMWVAYAGSAVIAVVAILLVQVLIKRLKDTEDSLPTSLVGIQGVATTAIDPSRGEVSLDAVHELERRLAWSNEPVPEGARIIVVEQSGSRVRVRQHFASD